MSDFVVRIDTAKLNERQAAALSSAIQGAVLAELGKLDLAHAAAPAGGSPFGSIIFHPEWRGLWLRNLKELQLPQQQILVVQAK